MIWMGPGAGIREEERNSLEDSQGQARICRQMRKTRFQICRQIGATTHVETVCLLSNRKPDARVKIDVDLEDYYRIKDEQKKNKASE